MRALLVVMALSLFINPHAALALRAPIARPSSSMRLQSLNSAASAASSLLSHIAVRADDKFALWAVAASAASIGLRLERNTKVGKSLSGPVCAMLVTATLTNLGVLPASGSVHMTELQGFVVKLATPLLLLGADLRKIFRETGSLLFAFCLGTFSTILGSTVGYALFGRSLATLGVAGDGWKIASALTAKNIGGGLNFMAVCSALAVSPSTLGVGLAVDNLLGLIYFPFISFLGQPFEERKGRILLGQLLGVGPNAEPTPPPSSSALDEDADQRAMSTYSTALALGLGIVAVSEHLGRAVGMSPVATSTLLTVALASIQPKAVAPLVPAGDLLGKLLLLLFFGSIGNSSGTVAAALSSKGVAGLLGFGSILYAVHIATILTVGRALRFQMPDLLLASNANIGNAATATALASAKGWRSRLLPALLVGTFGNAVATFIGIGISALFKRAAL